LAPGSPAKWDRNNSNRLPSAGTQERNDEFAVAFAKVINQFAKELLSDFCNADGSIDWDKLLAFNSGRPAPKPSKI
jgi:hypothetical protein